MEGVIAGDGSLVLKVYYDRNTETKYTVEYYQQNLEGNDYDLVDTVDKTGKTGAEVQAEIKTYAGCWLYLQCGQVDSGRRDCRRRQPGAEGVLYPQQLQGNL